MVFLFQDQNQGTRHVGAHATMSRERRKPFSFIRTVTVGFGVAPNLLTLSLEQERKALAGLGVAALTAGGDFHPALRTSAARYERPDWNYKPHVAAGKGLGHAAAACPHARKSNLGGLFGAKDRPANSLTNCKRGDSHRKFCAR
jgi:hypothetical protein